MNEVVKRLLQQATSYTWNGDGVTEELDEQKFAELIVQECANAIVNDSRLNDVRSAANGCVRTINEHFGVTK